MSTIKDVAKYTGLSIATISKYVNGGNVLDENKIIIKSAIEALDYKPNTNARGLKTKKTYTIGVLIPSLTNTFYTRIISTIEDALEKKGYGMIVCDFKEDSEIEKKKLEFLLSKSVDGVIMVSYGENHNKIKELLSKKLPFVLLDHMIDDIHCDIVIADNLNASYHAVEELIKRQHKKIGIICGPESTYTALERKKGYIRVHQDYSVPVLEQYIENGAYSVDGGYQSLKKLWALKDRPSAVLVTNYEMTLGAIMAINDLKIKVPDQLSIIGFDNIQMAKVIQPPLSVVEQPMIQIGQVAADLMLRRLNNDWHDFPSVNRLKTKVLIKDSVSFI